ncbi:protein NETWORKED 4A-like [Salvia splendens]|uniref:protein NETWORKED 4A-like n=1 Tax=Salvia splendens TaxID=180675 RepID=UPI001C26FFC3|nr:protein NETWORKED 4A-like [Salvia splendens]XP_042042350.1 protein NETWORKED 4A-like [Salvia splendens]XP_042042351.1 protein NETWORKED 4A-like [Salvia splendens]XP_042042352.1 protein NETWORKED 4A-like [Salvia splendens]
MASSLVKLNKMKRLESKKSHSWWWDSHVSPRNSKWLQENLEEMDVNVKRMLKLIEEDADSFAKKAELYFKKRPELVSLVEEFYRMYRALAERYDHVTGELKKNIPSDLRSQGSGVSDVGSEPPSTGPSPDTKPARTKSGPRAAGFEFFLGSNGSGSDLNSKEGDESSTLDSESESDDSSVNNYSSTQSNSEEVGSRRRVVELEAELHEVREKLRVQTEEISNGKQCSHECSEINLAKLSAYEDELRIAKENMEASKEEITRLKIELQKYESLGDLNDVLSSGVLVRRETETLESSIVLEQGQETELQENNIGSEGEVGLEHKIRRLEQELRSAEKKLRESEEEVASLRRELTSKGSSVQNLQDQLKSAQKEVAVWKNKVEREKRDAARLQDRIVRYKTNLSERDQEIRGLKESIGNANKALAEENELLQAEMTRMTKERAYLEDSLKEIDLRCQSLEDDVRRLKSAKDEAEAVLGAQIELLKADIAERDNCVEELNGNLDVWKVKHDMLAAARDELNAKVAALGAEISSRDEHLHELHLQHVKLIVSVEEARKSAEDLRSRVVELEMDVERKQEAILEGAEEKREAIRQLCFSIEHYRSGYHQLLREAVTGQHRLAVTAR